MLSSSLSSTAPGDVAAEEKSFLFHPAITVAIVALAGSVAPSAPAPALAAALGWLAIFALHPRFRIRKSPLFSLAGLLVLFLATGARTTGAVSNYQAAYFAAASALGGPQRCAGQVEITRSPTLRRHGIATRRGNGFKDGELLWTGRASALDCEGRQIVGPLEIHSSGGPADLARGDRVDIVAQLAPVRLFRNASLPDPWPGAARRRAVYSGSGIWIERSSRGTSWESMVDRARAQVRGRILTTYHPDAESLGRALVLGESDLNDEEANAFKRSGLMHLLAVSGTHLVIAVLAFVGFLRGLLVRISPLARRYDVTRWAMAGGAPASLLYADFAGGSGSAWRAAFMLTVVCLGRSLGVRVGGAVALATSILIGLLLDPLAGSDFSFLLSALATAGLIGLGRPLTRLCLRGWAKKAPCRLVVESFAATISSTVPCCPVLSLMDGNMTGAALFANVIAGPLGEMIALPACLLHGLVSSVAPLEKGLAIVGSGALLAVGAVARTSASVEGARFHVPYPSPEFLAVGLCFVATLGVSWALVRSRGSHARWVGSALLIGFGLVAACSIRPSKPRTLSVTALDVGQGDALVIDFPDGTTALLDGGGFATGHPDTGARVVLPYLRARGIERLSLILLSHPHPDHMSGLLTVAAEIPHDELWIPGAGVPIRGRLGDLIRASQNQGARLLTSDDLCDRPVKRGGVRLEVLWPCLPPDPTLSANDASVVVRLTHGARQALLTGDIEARAEDLLLADRAPFLRADFLKVAHHGSDTSSSPAFLRAVSPHWAFISSGIRNRFDHPRKSTLAHLQSAGIQVLRTDQWGSLTWTTDGRDQWIHTFSVEPPPLPHSRTSSAAKKPSLEPAPPPS